MHKKVGIEFYDYGTAPWNRRRWLILTSLQAHRRQISFIWYCNM